MFSSNTVPAYGFPSIKNAISLNSQSSSIVVSPWNGQQDGTANENGNIMLTYNGGSKAQIINNNGQLILGADNPDFSGSTYGGDNGGTDNVLTSDGTNGLKWVTPEYAPLWSQFPATSLVDIDGHDVRYIDGLSANNILAESDITVNRSNTGLTNLPPIIVGTLTSTVFEYPPELDTFGIVYGVFTNPVQVLFDAGVFITGITYYARATNGQTLEFRETTNPLDPPLDCTVFTAGQIPFAYMYASPIIQTAVLSYTLTITTETDVSVLSATNLTFNDVPYSRNMINSSLIYSSAVIYADGSAPATNLLIRNTYGYSGWYFKNTVASSKVNWYFAPQQSTVTSVADIKGLAISFFNGATTSNDNTLFLTIYTIPTGIDDYVPGFFHSSMTYVFDQAVSPVENTNYQGVAICDLASVPAYYETQVAYEESTINNPKGTYLPTDKVLAVVIGSNSTSAVNSVEFVVSKLNIIMDGFTQSLMLVPP